MVSFCLIWSWCGWVVYWVMCGFVICCMFLLLVRMLVWLSYCGCYWCGCCLNCGGWRFWCCLCLVFMFVVMGCWLVFCCRLCCVVSWVIGWWVCWIWYCSLVCDLSIFVILWLLVINGLNNLEYDCCFDVCLVNV